MIIIECICAECLEDIDSWNYMFKFESYYSWICEGCFDSACFEASTN